MKPANADGSVDVRILSEREYVRAKELGFYITLATFAIALVLAGFAWYLEAYPTLLVVAALAVSAWTVGRASLTTRDCGPIALVRDGREVSNNVRPFALLREAMPVTPAQTP